MLASDRPQIFPACQSSEPRPDEARPSRFLCRLQQIVRHAHPNGVTICGFLGQPGPKGRFLGSRYTMGCVGAHTHTHTYGDDQMVCILDGMTVIASRKAAYILCLMTINSWRMSHEKARREPEIVWGGVRPEKGGRKRRQASRAPRDTIPYHTIPYLPLLTAKKILLRIIDRNL